jgi:hypothetical protein
MTPETDGQLRDEFQPQEKQPGRALPYQPGEQVEDLQPDRYVKHGHGLGGEQHVRAGGQRPGDHHPLPLPGRQLMRVLARDLFRRRQVHRREQPVDLLVKPTPECPAVQREEGTRQVVSAALPGSIRTGCSWPASEHASGTQIRSLGAGVLGSHAVRIAGGIGGR